MSYSLDVRRPLGDATSAAAPRSDAPSAIVRVGLPVLGGLLSAAGLILVWAGHRRAGPLLFVAGAGLSAVVLGAKALEAEQLAGRL